MRTPALLGTLLLVACAGKTSPETLDASTDGGVDAPGDAPASSCPASPPTAGGACPKEGLACGYGDDPRLECRPEFDCKSGQWVDASIGTPCPPLATSCPEARDAAQGAACTTDGAVCGYSGLPCTCTNCDGGPAPHCEGPTTWHCQAPPTDPACPTSPPNVGTACTVEGKICAYGCSANGQRVCTGGLWAARPGNCPISTAAWKKDIEYLDDAQLQSLARDAQSLKLARWVYKTEPTGTTPHVGIVVEDALGTPAVAPSKDRVDLYGYTSMALAIAQTQQKQIEALEKRIRELESRCAK